jgi:sugar lactone lactonase YvrE
MFRLFVIDVSIVTALPDIPYNAKWKCNALTVAGGSGSIMGRLHYPKGLWMDNNHTMLIADSLNHRIMKYNRSTGGVQRIAGKNMQGYRPDLLDEPSNMIYDTVSKSFIICDCKNRRVLRKNKTYTKAIIQNVECFGLAMDDKGSIYVSDTERHEVRRYRAGKKYGTVVAGGNGQGRRLNQLNHPTYICIGDDQSVYVSDSWNDRVVRWNKGAKKGVIVAGGNGKGMDRTQLNYPAGILVDRLGTVYVADHWNHRVMRWRWGDDKPIADVIAGDHYLPGNYPNQMNGPEGLAFDQDGNLYVADAKNHRIQRFKIKTM